MIRSRLCDYIDAYILPKGTITVENRGTAAAQNNRNKKVIFKNCGPFTDCKSEINNKEIDHAKDNEVVTPMHNLLEYSDKYPKKIQKFLDDNGDIIDVPDDADRASFKYKQKTTDKRGNNGTTHVQIKVPLKYLSNFWRTLEMSLINCEINIFLTWSEKSIIVTGDYADREPKFAITETKLYVPVVTLLTVDNEKLLQQLKTGCKITINWNKYQSEPTTKTRNQYLNHLIDPSFQGVNRLFVLSYENDAYQNKLQATTSKRKQCCD